MSQGTVGSNPTLSAIFMRKNQMALNLFTKFSAIFVYLFMRLIVKLPVSTSVRWQWGHSFSMMPV